MVETEYMTDAEMQQDIAANSNVQIETPIPGAEGGGDNPPSPANPPADNPPADPPAPDTTNYEALTGGRYKDRDSFNSFLEKAVDPTVYEQVKSEYEKIKDNVIANDFVRGINELVVNKAPVDTLINYIKIGSEDISTMSDRDAIVNTFVFRDGLKGDEADYMAQKKYPTLGKTAEVVAREQGIEVQEAADLIREQALSAKLEANQSRGFLTTFKQEVFKDIPDRAAESQKSVQLAAEAQSAWQSIAPTIQLPEKKVFSVKEEGIDYSYELALPKDVLKPMVDKGIEYLISQGKKPDQQAVAELVRDVEEAYFLRNKDQIIGSIIRDSYAKATKERDDYHSNPQPPGIVLPKDADVNGQQTAFGHLR